MVIAAWNEGSIIGDVVAAIRAATDRVVVVDDCSRDATADAACRAGAIVLRHVLNRGQGAALQTGIDYALAHGARFVVTMDADGQHSPEDLPALLAPLVSGQADVALGSRFLDARNTIPPVRRLMLRCAVLFTRMTARIRVTDTHNGFRAFTREAAARIHITLDRMAHASELLDQIHDARLRYVEVPVRVHYTPYSQRKGQSSAHAVRVAFDYFIGRWMR